MPPLLSHYFVLCSFFFNKLCYNNWISLYILWELSLVKELGFEINLPNEKNSSNLLDYAISINNKSFKKPKLLFDHTDKNASKDKIIEALAFNNSLPNLK